MNNVHKMEIFACRASRDFASKVIDGLNAIKSPGEPEYRLGDLEVTPFSDGEFQPAYMESVRGATVFLSGCRMQGYKADTPINVSGGAKIRAVGCFDKDNNLLELAP